MKIDQGMWPLQPVWLWDHESGTEGQASSLYPDEIFITVNGAPIDLVVMADEETGEVEVALVDLAGEVIADENAVRGYVTAFAHGHVEIHLQSTVTESGLIIN